MEEDKELLKPNQIRPWVGSPVRTAPRLTLRYLQGFSPVHDRSFYDVNDLGSSSVLFVIFSYIETSELPFYQTVNRRFYNEIVPYLMQEEQAFVFSKDYKESLGLGFKKYGTDGELFADLNSWKVTSSLRTRKQFFFSALYRVLLIFLTVPLLLVILVMHPLLNSLKGLIDSKTCCMMFFFWPWFFALGLLYNFGVFIGFFGPVLLLVFWLGMLTAVY